jgi:hypothetical protein
MLLQAVGTASLAEVTQLGGPPSKRVFLDALEERDER